MRRLNEVTYLRCASSFITSASPEQQGVGWGGVSAGAAGADRLHAAPDPGGAPPRTGNVLGRDLLPARARVHADAGDPDGPRGFANCEQDVLVVGLPSKQAAHARPRIRPGCGNGGACRAARTLTYSRCRQCWTILAARSSTSSGTVWSSARRGDEVRSGEGGGRPDSSAHPVAAEAEEGPHVVLGLLVGPRGDLALDRALLLCVTLGQVDCPLVQAVLEEVEAGGRDRGGVDRTRAPPPHKP